jgi:hypothetical protein
MDVFGAPRGRVFAKNLSRRINYPREQKDGQGSYDAKFK